MKDAIKNRLKEFFNTVYVAKVYDDNGKLREVLIPNKYNCHALSISELCGGCDSCLLNQYVYYNMHIVYKKMNEYVAEKLRRRLHKC